MKDHEADDESNRCGDSDTENCCGRLASLVRGVRHNGAGSVRAVVLRLGKNSEVGRAVDQGR